MLKKIDAENRTYRYENHENVYAQNITCDAAFKFYKVGKAFNQRKKLHGEENVKRVRTTVCQFFVELCCKEKKQKYTRQSNKSDAQIF